MKNIFFGLLAIIVYLGMGQVLNAQAVLESNVLMGMEGLYFWYADPAAPVARYSQEITPKGDCFDIVNGYAFLTWYKGGMQDRNLMVSRMKLGTNHWVTVEFPEKNSLYGDGSGDSHKTASVGISAKDGTVHLAYDMHSGPLKYRVSKKGIAFGPDETFTLENFLPQQNYLKSGAPILSCTYPGFKSNDAGELIFNFRIGTSRQGNMNFAYYDGNVWSSNYTVVKGDNVDPQFNLYGGLSYFNGRMYLIGSIRVYGSAITYNQGVYFGIGGQRGNEPWSNLAGQSYPIPLSNTLTPFKVVEPLPPGHDGMTSAATGVVSQGGAYHFTAQVSGYGIYHYLKLPNSDTLIEGKAPAQVGFCAGDRVYVSYISNTSGRLQIDSTPENAINWTGEYGFLPATKFASFVDKYYNGKLYMVASESKSSDKRPLRFLVFDLGVGEPPALKLSYPLDGNTQDASGNNFHGSLTGGGGFAPSLVQHDQGLILDGVDDYVAVPGYKGVIGGNSRTCSVWIKTAGSVNNMAITSWGTIAAGGQWLLGVFNTGELALYSGGPYIKAAATIADNRWHHVAAVLSDDGSPNISEVKLYIDGQLRTDTYITGSQTVNTLQGNPVRIGCLDNAGVPTAFFKGQIDDVRIYNYALTTENIASLAAISRPSIDIVADNVINTDDFLALAGYWLNGDCYSVNLCDGRDLNADQVVNSEDFSVLAQRWLSLILTDEMIENDSPKLSYTGSWTTQSGTTDSGESMTWSSTAGSTVSYTFTGSRAVVVVRYGPYGGNCDVKLDGVVVADNVNTYANPAVYDVEIYDSGTIGYGEHTVELISNGSGNTMFDYFHVQQQK